MAGYDTISKKQAGVIFGAWKRGEIEAAQGAMNMVYGRYVGYGSPTSDARVLDVVSKLKGCVDALFAKDAEAASAKFAEAVEAHFCNFSDSTYKEA